MYLKQSKAPSGKIYLSMVQTYYDREKKQPRTKTIETFGTLQELKKDYDDPVAHFKQIVANRNQEEKEDTAEYTVIAKKNAELSLGVRRRMNYGYIVILKLYYELGLDRFFLNKQRNEKFKYNTSTISKHLLISRILTPGSKKKCYEDKDRYFDFEKQDIFSLDDVYRCLSHLAKISEDVQKYLNRKIKEKYRPKSDLIYYDVTNYYFEIEEEDDLRRKGPSKEHRPDPIVQMGLATDESGFPLSYDLFPGNESEKLRLRPMIGKLRREYDSGKIVVVADKAQNSGNNIYYLESGKNGYIFSEKILGASEDTQNFVLNGSGYKWLGDEYRYKSRTIPREINVSMLKDGKERRKKVQVDQKQIVFYSEKYAKRAKAKRDVVIKKAYNIIANPSSYTRATSYGALRFVDNIEVDKKTGELKEAKSKPCIDFDKIREEEKFDGYYMIVTNQYDERDTSIIEKYHGLWQIENCFKVTKQDLETRPIHLSREDRINAHFLICFISLLMVKLIQQKLDDSYPIAQIVETMNNISCSNESANLFLFDYRTELSDYLGKAFSLDFTKERLTRAAIKKNIAEVKKV